MTQIYLTMPQPGETITEGSVVAWMLPVGSHVKEGQAVVELETEKALFEYESPFEGEIIKILANPNSKVAVGAPIAILEVAADRARAYTSLGLGQKVDSGMCVKAVSEDKDQEKVNSKFSKSDIQDTTKKIDQKTSENCEINSGKMPESDSIFFSPYIRRLLREHNINAASLSGMKGRGPHGRLTKEDVEDYVLKNSSNGELNKLSSLYSYKDRNVAPIRSRIAQNMLLSKQTIPHAHTGLDVDLSAVINLKNQLKNDFLNSKGFSLKLMPLVFMALQKACREVPVVNSRYLESDNKIRLFKNLNLGMAMGTKNGLMTPVIKNCESMSFMDFAKAYDSLVIKSDQNKLKPSDFEGATFTFNNFGAFGLDFGVQVIPPGQACVLGMGAIHKKPCVVEDQISVRDMATFFLAFDHRLMDGREAGEFLTSLKKVLETINIADLL